MFTGIIREIGTVKRATQGENLALRVQARKVASILKKGDSVAINGVCQTLIESSSNGFAVEAIGETLSRTNLSDLMVGDKVNLEAPLGAGDMFHGHFVQGHVDCTGRIADIENESGSVMMGVDFPEEYGRYVIEKGSITVDGVSLTVVGAGRGSFSVALIPYTLENTIFKYRRAGDIVNLEFDIIAKYLEALNSGSATEKLTIGFLREHGFD